MDYDMDWNMDDPFFDREAHQALWEQELELDDYQDEPNEFENEFEQAHQQARGDFAKEVVADLQRDHRFQNDIDPRMINDLFPSQVNFPIDSASDTPPSNQVSEMENDPSREHFISLFKDDPYWKMDEQTFLSNKKARLSEGGVNATIVGNGPNSMVLKFSGVKPLLIENSSNNAINDIAEPLPKKNKLFHADGNNNTTQSEPPTTTLATADSNKRRSLRPSTANIPKSTNIVDFTKRSDWYGDLETKKTLAKDDLESITITMDIIEACLEANCGKEREVLFSDLRTRVHAMEFFAFLTPNGPNESNDFAASLIKDSKILEEGGLPEIFGGSRSDIFPFDIRADAEALCARWMGGDLNPHLLRGVDSSKIVLLSGIPRVVYTIQKDYLFKKASNVFGHNNLVNGQWWPQRRCALRDGAHGEVEAGIWGQTNVGAFAICIAHGGYDDRDNGDEIEYCGTKGKNGVASRGTSFLELSFQNSQPLRILRGPNKASKFAPKLGIRYDGLYKITNSEVLDQKTAMKRFTLKRIAGQDPIRYQGEEARPTAKEIMELQRIRKFLA
ncbi:hypothetical protein HYFRA_00002016 [Hymenoscyphus fraxineus]|uniref:YDG domain-containing protein n=1 Tax=Hymenoscyphus fraxineus TaxID=746836 RepID=A0A9N9PNZ1_9HELO|nr:hypothetical protein HYFRA_00002016 [Hymenoscyphus fraxineus]